MAGTSIIGLSPDNGIGMDLSQVTLMRWEKKKKERKSPEVRPKRTDAGINPRHLTTSG